MLQDALCVRDIDDIGADLSSSMHMVSTSLQNWVRSGMPRSAAISRRRLSTLLPVICSRGPLLPSGYLGWNLYDSSGACTVAGHHLSMFSRRVILSLIAS